MATKKTPEEIEISKRTRTKKATAAEKDHNKGKRLANRTIGKGDDPTDYIPNLSTIEWIEEEGEISEKDKMFVYWYTTLDTPLWHNKSQCAKKVGSRAKAENLHGAGNVIYNRVKKTIERIENSKRDYLITKQRELNLRNTVTRCNFNIRDFYTPSSFYDKAGNEVVTLALKSLNELTPEQLACIDGIEYDKFGRPNYKLANREKSIDRIDKLIETLEGNSNSEKYDVSLTVEGIRDKLETKVTIIKEHKELTRQATGIEESTGNEEL